MAKHYVNLPFDKARKHKDRGRQVPLVATPAQLGDKVGVSEWWVEPVGKNTDTKYLSASARALLLRPFATPRGGKFFNHLVLPHVGGDKYVVKCAKKGEKSKALKLEEVETWRKIFYTVYWMNKKCEDMFQKVKPKIEAAFKEAFVEFEYVTGSKTKKDEKRTPSTETTYNLPHLYDAKKPLKDKPFHLRVVVLNDIYDVVERPMDKPGFRKLSYSIRGGAPLADRTPDDWLKSASVKIEASGRVFNIRKYCKKLNDTDVAIDYSAHPRLSAAVNRGRTLTLSVVLRRREHFEGYSINNFCVVRVESVGVADVEANMLQTFTHEVGHGLQQVVQQETLYDASGNGTGTEKNPKWHDDRFGGRGPHCSTNATLAADPSGPAGSKIYVPDWWTKVPIIGGKLCTMYFSADDAVDPAGKFCPNCVPRLTRTNLGRTKMQKQGWDQY
jgi:hypothetical protein